MNFTVFSDEHFMKLAFQQAQLALEQDEIPVGAIVVCQNQVIARAFNRTEALQDVTAHAEILALTTAAEYLGSKYLTDCTLYVTLEPCVMCAGAMKWAQLDRLVFGASDDKEGFMRYGKELLHPQTKVEMGLMAEQCSQLLKDFFKEKRELSKLR